MKFTVLLLSSFIFISSAWAQKPDRKLIYCDHLAGRNNLYMDIYLHYDEDEQVFTNPEVAFFDSTDKASYPGYLWPISVIFDPSTYESRLIIDKGTENQIQFSIPARPTGIVLPTTEDENIVPFSIVAEGTYKGYSLQDMPFSCYNVFIP